MQLSEFDFPFDPALIASQPVDPRDQARLLVLPRAPGDTTHRRVADLPSLLQPGDLLVLNDTKVLPARLVGKRATSGGRVELLLVKELGTGIWEVLIKGTVNPGQVVELRDAERLTVLERSAKRTTVQFTGKRPVQDLLHKIGEVPLPPYIKREPSDSDRAWYQTVFAREEGAIAAPTAGLHFTQRLLDALRERGVAINTITLHVGPGTFLPVKTERIHDHQLAPEQVEVPENTVRAVAETKWRGGRVVAVGTTVVRSLEAASDAQGVLTAGRGVTDLFIMPGYRFRVIDGLMTNFHLPRTTLLMLVAALTGVERLRGAYQVAVTERYRFYSYGDAMIIL
jgi:S-adenosylmethionine:tRNA ribosyltransferase-isomerase